jgi:hypothetical protein
VVVEAEDVVGDLDAERVAGVVVGADRRGS